MTWTATKALATLLEQLVRQEVTYHDDAKSAPDFVIGYEIKASSGPALKVVEVTTVQSGTATKVAG